jgi:hypothetical protein
MSVSTLGWIITIAGIVFLFVCLLIAVFGKKIDGPNARQQRIKVAGKFEVTANSIIILFLIGLVLTLSPIVLQYWKGDYILKDDVNKDYIAKKDLVVELLIPYSLENGQKADSVTVQFQAIKGKDTLSDEKEKCEEGFYETTKKIEPGVEYSLTFKRSGYPEHKFRYTFNKIRSRMTLTKN